MARWTKEEIEWLQNHRTPEGRLELATRSGRSYSSVSCKAKKLGLVIEKKDNTQVYEFIRDNYLKLGARECAKILNIKLKDLYHKAKNYGISTGRNKDWSQEQENFLRANIYKLSLSEISAHLQRSLSSVKNKAHKLNILSDKKWTAEEDELLKKKYQALSTEELAKDIGRSYASIVGRAFTLGLAKKHHEWTDEQEDWLKIYFPIRSDEHCARYLNTTESSVINRAHKMGLQKKTIKYVSGDIKYCPTCDKDKDISEFQYKIERDGYSSRCKECLNENGKKRKISFLPEQEAIIKDLYSKGHGAPEIAEITKFSGKSKMSQFIKQEGISRTSKETHDLKNAAMRGQKFGKLTLIEQLRIDDKPHWKCVCDCGNEKVINQYYLGYTQSCGCLVTQTGKDHFAWGGYEEISGALYARYKAGARERNLPFEISKEDMWNQFAKQERKCALTGILLNFGEGTNVIASLDRIDSFKGYTKDNIQWVHKWINVFKSNLPESDLFAIVKACYEYKQLAGFSMPTLTMALNRTKRKPL